MKRAPWVIVFFIVGQPAGEAGRQTPPRPTVPALVRWMPSSPDLLGYADLSAIADAGWRGPGASASADRRLEPLGDLEEVTGLDPWRDLDAAAFSARSSGAGQEPLWSVAAAGRFDAAAVAAGIERSRAIETRSHRGTKVYLVETKGGAQAKPLALAFPEEGVLFFGSREQVEAMLDVHAGAVSRSAASSAPLASWWDDIAGESFWLVGTSARTAAEILGKDEPPVSAGPLRSFAVSGRLPGRLEVTARGEADDPASAEALAAVARGFVALGRLQQPSRPEVQELLDAIEVEVRENRVVLFLSAAYETLAKLAPPAPGSDH